MVSNPNHSWILGWWMFTRRTVEALTAPPGDTAGCDREVERLARESRLGSLARRTAAAIGAAWRQSWSRAVMAAIVGDLRRLPAAAAIRAVGWTTTVASATALVLNAFRSMSSGPLTWVVPAAATAIGALLMAVAGPVARAWGDRRPESTRS
jgi:hypothetical protein